MATETLDAKINSLATEVAKQCKTLNSTITSRYASITPNSFVSIPSGTNYTASSDGYIWCWVHRPNENVGKLSVTLNSIQLPIFNANNYSHNDMLIPVKKNDVIKWTNTSSEAAVKFTPTRY